MRGTKSNKRIHPLVYSFAFYSGHGIRTPKNADVYGARRSETSDETRLARRVKQVSTDAG